MKHFVIIIFFATFFPSCNVDESNSSNEKHERNKRIGIITQNLKNNYKILDEVDIMDYKYTIHFNKAFIDSSYLFLMNPLGGVDDFLKKNNKNYIRAKSLTGEIYCELECEEIMFNELLDIYNNDTYKEIMLVIKPSFIDKLFLTANPENNGDMNLIEIDFSSTFLLKGKLITYRLIN